MNKSFTQSAMEEFEKKFSFDVDGKRNWMIIRELEFLSSKLEEAFKEAYEVGREEGKNKTLKTLSGRIKQAKEMGNFGSFDNGLDFVLDLLNADLSKERSKTE